MEQNNYFEKSKKAWECASDFPPDKEQVYPDHSRVQEFDLIHNKKVYEYGCFPADTMIFTDTGLVKIQNLKVGNHIFSVSSNEKIFKIVNDKITAVVNKGIKDTFLVETLSNKFITTDDHKFLIIRKTKNKFPIYWIEAKFLEPGDILVLNTLSAGKYNSFTLPEVSFKYKGLIPKLTLKTTSPDLMRFIGFYLGDGNIQYHTDRHPYSICLSEPVNTKYRKKYLNLVKVLFPNITITESKEKIHIHSVELGRLLISLGLSGNVYQKRIPDWVFSLPISERLALIEGLSDADGWRMPERYGKKQLLSKGNIVIELCNKKLIEDVAKLCKSLNLYVGKISYRKRKNAAKYILNSGIKEYVETWALRIRPEKNNGKSLPGKYKQLVGHWEGSDGFYFNKILSTQYTGEKEEVYDISTEKYHNFIANGVVVHNCGMGSDVRSYLKRGNHVTATDIVPKNVETARKFTLDAGYKADQFEFILLEQSYPLPFSDNSFDVISSHGVLHHIKEGDKVIEELYRVCKPGGNIYVMVYTDILWQYHLSNMQKLMRFRGIDEYEAFCWMTDGEGTPYARSYSAMEACDFVEKPGFTVVDFNYWLNDWFITVKGEK